MNVTTNEAHNRNSNNIQNKNFTIIFKIVLLLILNNLLKKNRTIYSVFCLILLWCDVTDKNYNQNCFRKLLPFHSMLSFK